MKKLLFTIFVLTFISLNGYTQEFLNWQRFTDGTSHSDDSAVAIEATGAGVVVGGNIYNSGTGSDIVIQNYDLDGNLVWKTGYASSFNDHLSQINYNDTLPFIYGAGNSDNGSYLIGLLIKMDMKGNLLWSKTFSGSGNIRFENLKVAPNGNITVVGERMLSLFVSNEIIACYNSDGKLLWSHIGKEQSGESEFNHLQIDAAGKIYASGYMYNGTNKDGYIAKYNANGKLLNSITINGTGNKDDEVKGIALFNGTLYAATVGRVSGAYNEATVSAYKTSDFSSLWTKNYSSVNGDIDIAGIIGPEISGDIMLAGVQGNFSSGTSDYLALSYNGISGNLNWSKTISRGTGYNNIATAMALNAYGDLLITGGSNLVGAAVDMFTVDYDHSGNLLWTKVFNGDVNGDDYPTAIGADVNGDIFIAGTSAQATTTLAPAKTNRDFTVLKYSSKFICSVPTNLYADSISSSFAWLHWDVMPEALKYKLQYRVVGGTWTSVNITSNNKIITGLAPKTKYQWRVKTICSNNPAVSSDYSVTKPFYTLGSGFASSSFDNADNAIAKNKTGLQLFPNPGKQIVNLQLNNIDEGNVNVKLFDIAGRELKHYPFSNNSKTFTRQIDVSFLSAGSYIIEIISSKQKWSQVLIKQ